jgi:hypothetical protein
MVRFHQFRRTIPAILYPLDLSSADENIHNLDNLAGRFFGTDLGDLGRVGAVTIRTSSIATGLGDGGNGLACRTA